MKPTRIMITIAFVLFALLASAVAQTRAVQVNIPFGFTVGHKIMTPGSYEVSIRGPLLRVARIDGTDAAIVLTNCTGGGIHENLDARLVFHRYGDRRFLSQAWFAGNSTGHVLYSSAAELEYARAAKQDAELVVGK